MQKVGGSKVDRCRGWIMSLEARQADRSERDAFAQDEAVSFSTQKNWEQFARPVSRNPKELEGCFCSLVKLIHHLYAKNGTHTHQPRVESKM